ncbi:MAG: rubrerythrin family protein [Lachnospiraceae bacterium]|nr:rubrerythrin family protein [Lachnospiraceae bacterium]
MAVQFCESKTKENLMKAFAGESQARNRYTFAAKKARELGYESIAQVFEFTAEQERAHGERYYQLLNSLAGETVTVDGTYPVDIAEDICELLDKAEHNEFEEYEHVYPQFAQIAKEEGFLEAASAFTMIGEVEQMHGKRFRKLAELLRANQFDKSTEEEKWMCLNCGYIHTGTQVPPNCPSCHYEKGYFIPLSFAPFQGNIVC